LSPMNTMVKKGLEVSKSNADSLASIIANAVGVILRYEAHRSKRGRWFVVNLLSDDAVKTLTGFLNLPYDDFVLLFQETGCSIPFLRCRHRAYVLTMTRGKHCL